MRATAVLVVFVFCAPSVSTAAAPVEAPRPVEVSLPVPPDLAVPPLTFERGVRGAAISFVVEGALRINGTNSVVFRFAKDGDRRICIIRDGSDGTPFMIADERRMLVYDLTPSKIVLAPGIGANLSVDYDDENEKPWRIQCGWGFAASDGINEQPKLRIDRFLSACRTSMRCRREGDGTLVLTANGKTWNTLRLDPTDTSRFSFTHECADDGTRLEVGVTRIGQPIPEEIFRFPDVDALAQDGFLMRVEDSLQARLRYAGTLAGLHKLGLSIGGTVSDPNEQAEILRRDRELGSRYRAALVRQGFLSSPTPVLPSAAKGEKYQ